MIWLIRLVCVLAVLSGVVLLIADSPLSAYVHLPVSRAVIEATPLLLVGIAFLGWLVVDRPGVVDLIKQGFIALAFILWGVDLLIPGGRWATFIGAVVIAIYVFDLAWLMEGNFRKMTRARQGKETLGCTLAECVSSGVCRCESTGVKGLGGRARSNDECPMRLHP